MVNTRSKGTRKEHECLESFKAYIAEKKDYSHVAEWRSIAQKYCNTDVFSDFDLLLAYNYKSIQVWFCIQVKSKFSLKYYKYLKARWQNAPVHCYLAVYGKLPRHIKIRGRESERLSIKGFQLVRI